jgi:hypothetical protein
LSELKRAARGALEIGHGQHLDAVNPGSVVATTAVASNAIHDIIA